MTVRLALLAVAVASACAAPPSRSGGADQKPSASSVATPERRSDISEVAIAPNGCRDGLYFGWLPNNEIAIACDSTIRVLDASLRERRRAATGLASLSHFETAPGASTIFIVDNENNWRLLDTTDFSERRSGAYGATQHYQYQLSPDAKYLMLDETIDSRLEVRSFASKAAMLIETSPGYAQRALWLTGNTFAFCHDGLARLGRVGSTVTRRVSQADSCGPMSRSIDGETLTMTTMTVDSGLLRWRTKTATALPALPEAVDTGCRSDTAPVWLSKDRMVRAGDPEGVGVVEVGDQRVSPVWWQSSGERVRNVSASPDGHAIAGVCGGNALCVWDAERGARKRVAALDSRHTSELLALARSANDQLLTSASIDGALRMWDLRAGTMSSVIGAVTYTTQTGTETHLVGPVGKQRSVDASWRKVRTRCLHHRHLDAATLNVSPSGAHVLVEGNRRSLLAREQGAWRTLGAPLAGDFSREAFFLISDGAVLKKLTPEQADAAAERVPTTLKGLSSVRVSGNGKRLAIAGADDVELRMAQAPFALLGGPVKLGRLLAISANGVCMLGSNGRFCEGARDVFSIKPAPGPPSMFIVDESITLIGPAAFSGFLNLLAPSGRVELGMRRLKFGQSELLQESPFLRDFPSARISRHELAGWGVGRVNATDDLDYLFTWAARWFARGTADGSIEILSEPGGWLVATLRPIAGLDAGYVLTPDGRYDVVGGDAASAKEYLRCSTHGVVSPISDCERRYEPGLLAHVIDELPKAP